MRNLIKFILANHFLILFVLIEFLAILLVVQHNQFHRARFVNLTRNISGGMYQRVDKLDTYFSLREVNESLSRENTMLKNLLARGEFDLGVDTSSSGSGIQQFLHIQAKVINNSVNKQHNYITLNKGRLHGIEPEMAVICDDGVVGVVKGVSEHFSTAISLLNVNLRISAKIKNNNYFGSINWNGKSDRILMLNEIPHHVKLQAGDTIVTSGYSVIFPEGVPIGVIERFEMKDGNFFDIYVRLIPEFRQLKYVHVVSNLMKDEQLLIEKSTQDD
jgi:rod shape-determining protein MreC